MNVRCAFQATDAARAESDGEAACSPGGKSTVAAGLNRRVEQIAQLAFEAYAALMKTQAADPSLLYNEQWVALRSTAYVHFMRAFERV